MPDITMCNPTKVEKKCKSCYRYKAKPNPYRQSYSNFYPACINDDYIYYYEEPNKIVKEFLKSF